MNNKYDVEKEWEFWKTIICNEDGTINVEQLKNELCDYSLMLGEVPRVYCEVTGSLLSKPHYYAESVIKVFNERYGEKAVAVDYLVDDWDDITADCETNEDYKKVVFEYLGCEEE
jgi:hypothetical protein